MYDDFEISGEVDDAVAIEGAANVPVCLTMSRVGAMLQFLFVIYLFFVMLACGRKKLSKMTGGTISMSFKLSLIYEAKALTQRRKYSTLQSVTSRVLYDCSRREKSDYSY